MYFQMPRLYDDVELLHAVLEIRNSFEKVPRQFSMSDWNVVAGALQAKVYAKTGINITVEGEECKRRCLIDLASDSSLLPDDQQNLHDAVFAEMSGVIAPDSPTTPPGIFSRMNSGEASGSTNLAGGSPTIPPEVEPGYCVGCGCNMCSSGKCCKRH